MIQPAIVGMQLTMASLYFSRWTTHYPSSLLCIAGQQERQLITAGIGYYSKSLASNSFDKGTTQITTTSKIEQPRTAKTSSRSRDICCEQPPPRHHPNQAFAGKLWRNDMVKDVYHNFHNQLITNFHNGAIRMAADAQRKMQIIQSKKVPKSNRLIFPY